MKKEESQTHAQAVANTPAWRRMAEILLERIVFERRLPASAGGGRIVVSTKVGGLKYAFKSSHRWDAKLLEIAGILVRKGASIWVIGANVGLFSRAAAFHAGENGTVLAIEADIDATALLNRTSQLRLSGHADITVVPVAISSNCGFLKFEIAKRARAANAIAGFGSTQTGGVKETRILPSVTLDSLLGFFRPPDVLKIDVEGAELEVLSGAKFMLESIRPQVYCEVQGTTRQTAVDLFSAAGYEVVDGDSFDGTGSARPVGSDTCNLLAIPNEKYS